jgi:hypothetical protein
MRRFREPVEEALHREIRSGLVVKLPKARVAELIATGVGEPFAPAGRVFKEWLTVPKPDRRRWLALLREGVAFVG